MSFSCASSEISYIYGLEIMLPSCMKDLVVYEQSNAININCCAHCSDCQCCFDLLEIHYGCFYDSNLSFHSAYPKVTMYTCVLVMPICPASPVSVSFPHLSRDKR